MKALVEVHYERPPCQLLADLDAFNVDRLITRTGRGAFVFNVSTAGLHREIIQEGRLVVIRSTTTVLPYVGVITKTEEDVGARTVEVSGDNYASVLYSIALDRTEPVSNISAGAIAARLLSGAQSMGRSVFLRVGSATGSHLPSELDFGAQHLGRALDALADRVDDEWWIEHVVTRQSLTHLFFWAKRRGIPRPDVLLQEGRDFTVASYKRDGIGQQRSAISVGGGGNIASRQSVAVAATPGSAASTATQINAGYQRGTTRVPPSPLLARDVIEWRVLDTDATTLADVAQRAFERPPVANESLALTATLTAAQRLVPGDTVTARFHSVNYGGMVRVVRINAMQPDEDSGECDLDVEVAA